MPVASRKSEKILIFRVFAFLLIPFLELTGRYRLHGTENLPDEGSVVVSPNHYSDIDPLVIGYSMYQRGRMPRFLAKASLFRVPVFGWMLRKAGQVPVEQRVCTVDEGKSALGVPLNYLRPQPVREYAASEWVAQWLQGSEAAGGRSEPSAAPSAPRHADLQRDADPEVELDLAAFVELLTSEMVCVWGECHNIRERKRLEKQHREAQEYASNPPFWQFWKWGSKPSG